MKDRGAFYDDLLARLAIGAPVDFGGTVRLLRKKVTGMNQSEFALACRIDIATLKKLERNQMSPDLILLGSILDLFGLQLSVTRQDRKLWRWSAAAGEFSKRRKLATKNAV